MLYSGRITREKGVELLAETFLAARARDERLHLMVAGGGPEQERLASLLGAHASFLGWLEGAELAQAYADADVFLFPSSTDTFGQVILEAQASGLPVVAVAEGGPLSLIEDGVDGPAARGERAGARRGAARAGRRAAAPAGAGRGRAAHGRGAGRGSGRSSCSADGLPRALERRARRGRRAEGGVSLPASPLLHRNGLRRRGRGSA